MSTRLGISPKSVCRRALFIAQAVFEEEDAQAPLAADHRPGLVGADAVDVDARLEACSRSAALSGSRWAGSVITITGVGTCWVSFSEPVAVTVVVAK